MTCPGQTLLLDQLNVIWISMEKPTENESLFVANKSQELSKRSASMCNPIHAEQRIDTALAYGKET